MILLAFSPAISVETGYVTLAELGRSLVRQGIRTRIDVDCAEDVYAIRAPRTDWPSLRTALLADGRLTISEDGGTWTIALDAANRAAERRALAEYQESVRFQLYELCEPAARQAKAWFALSYAQYVALEDAWWKVNGNRATQVDKASVSLGRARDARREGDYTRVSVPAALTAPGARLGVAWGADAVQATPLIDPQGHLLSNNRTGGSFGRPPGTRAEAVATLRGAHFAAKLVWDPLSLATGFRWGYWAPSFAQDLERIYDGESTWWLTSDGASPRGPASLEAPKTSWRPVVPGRNPTWEEEAAMPMRILSVSDAVLRWAEAKSENLVAYVSPLGDLPLAARSGRSLESVVHDLDAGTLDRVGLGRVVTAWVGEHGGSPLTPVASLPPMRRATLLQEGGFTVLRMESRFLDGLVAEELNVPANWLNGRLRAGAPTLDNAVRRVAALDPRRWKSGFFPVAMLDWCDPISFYPLAVLLANEPALRAQVAALAIGENLEWPLSSSRNPGPFQEAIERAAPFNNDIGVLGIDPLLAPLALRDAVIPPRVRVQRSRTGFWFQVSVASAEDSNDKDIWRSSVRLPQ